MLAHAKENGLLVDRSDAYWFAPVPRPGKLICIGLNYRDHAAESNMPIPERPDLLQFSTCVIAPGEPVVICQRVSKLITKRNLPWSLAGAQKRESNTCDRLCAHYRL
jgi:2-keto-4-pentenoate hydratase/2-oxohepta-3-ene-1,7-dioic acid hydratase in catechol pathway